MHWLTTSPQPNLSYGDASKQMPTLHLNPQPFMVSWQPAFFEGSVSIEQGHDNAVRFSTVPRAEHVPDFGVKTCHEDI